MHDAIKNALILAKNRRKYQTGGVPDDSSQEAFLQEQLQGSAPQYTPEEGMLTGKRAGLMAAGFAPGAGIATAAGQFPTAEGGKESSMAEDWRKGEYLSSLMKGLGAAGDIAYGVPLVGPAVGAAMKAPLVAKLAMAAAPMAKIAGEVAPATEAVSRVTNPIGMYSAAAEAARALPQEKGTLQQMLATMKGVTPEELHWSGVHQAFAGKPIVTREELAKHFEERLPGVSETVLGGADKLNINTESKYAVPEVLNIASFASRSPEDLLRTLENDFNAYKSLVNKFPDLENNENWAEIVVNDVFGSTSKPPETRFHDPKLQLPGGENYREVVLHLPPEKAKMEQYKVINPEYGFVDATYDNLESATRRAQQINGTVKYDNPLDIERGFRSSHWSQPNVLSHLRMSDRTGPEGEKILHLEELQSDWGQRGRKEGFLQKVTPELQEKVNLAVSKLNPKFVPAHARTSNGTEIDTENFLLRDIDHWKETGAITPEDAEALTEYSKIKSGLGLPPAPYVASPEGKHTLSWVDLGLKRALKEAAEGGYDKLIWTPGEEQAARYDLSQHVDELYHWRDGDMIGLSAYGPSGTVLDQHYVNKDKLDTVVGKELAKKIIDGEGDISHDQPEGVKVIRGDDLKVGGEGMKSFYDKIIPNQLQKIVKKLDKDAKVQLGGYPITAERGKPTQYSDFDEWNNAPESRQINAHVIQITPKMREAILKGFAAYADGGAVKSKQRNSSHLGPIIERGMKITHKLSVKKGQKPTTTIPKSPKYVPQAKENAEFRKLMAEVDELLEKFKD